MDGTNYFRLELPPAPETRAAEIAEIRKAGIITVACVMATIGGVLLLGQMGLSLPVTEEFPTSHSAPLAD